MPGSIFGDLGGAVSDIFGAVGQFKSASGYQKAAQYATQNAQISEESTAIQEAMAQRKIYQTIGGQQADVAGAGLAASGSALDLLRSSAEQGSLTKQLVANQGAINVAGYQAEAASYESMASAAKTAGSGGILGGILKGVGVIASIFSDDDLKENPVLVSRRADGLGIYEFNYKGTTQRFRGVLASEVERLYPEAVTRVDGYRAVDYALINVLPEVINA